MVTMARCSAILAQLTGTLKWIACFHVLSHTYINTEHYIYNHFVPSASSAITEFEIEYRILEMYNIIYIRYIIIYIIINSNYT